MKQRHPHSGRDEERSRRISEVLKARLGVAPAGRSAVPRPAPKTRKPKKATAFPQPTERLNRHQHEVYWKVKNWVARGGDFYVGFGGAGDAVLTIAACEGNPQARPIFFANHSTLTPRLFQAFGLNPLIIPNIMGQPWTHTVVEPVFSHPNFRPSAHLPLNLDYGDWKRNHDHYVKTVPTSAPWKQTLGHVPNPYRTDKVVVICPSGSVRDRSRQRHLSQDEYQALAQFYLKHNCTVLSAMSEDDLRYYRRVNHPHAAFVSAERFVDGAGRTRLHDVKTFLQYVNSASLVVSMDTWLKTYTLMVGIPTVVLKTRWHGRYKPVGDDISDYIFLHPKLWPNLRVAEVEPFVREQRCLGDTLLGP